MTDEAMPGAPPLCKTLTVINRLGLHLRAARALVETILPFTADVTFRNGSRSASGRSILSLTTLEAPAGTEVEVSASGPQAAECLAAIEDLFARRFGEQD